MKIIKDDSIEYSSNFYKVVNSEIDDIMQSDIKSILICKGNRNENLISVSLNINNGVKLFEVCQSREQIKSFFGNIVEPINPKVYDNLEDAYYDFLCCVKGYATLDNVEDVKRYAIKHQNKEVSLNLRVPKGLKMKITQCTRLISGYEKYIGETFEIGEMRQTGFSFGKYDENGKLLFASSVDFNDVEIL